MADQRDIQALIQGLGRTSPNNGNPNTIWNTPGTVQAGLSGAPYVAYAGSNPQQAALPPMLDAYGNWFTNQLSAPATLGPMTVPAFQYQPPAPGSLNLGPAWQAPPSMDPTLPTWFQPFAAPNVPGLPALPPGTPGTTAPPLGGPLPPEQVPGTINRPGQIPNPDIIADPMWEDLGCVVVDSVLEDYSRADQVDIDDEMSVRDPITGKRSTGFVSYSETKPMPCVRITTNHGVVLECSTTAPIADIDGNQILAPDLEGKIVPVIINGVFGHDIVTTVQDIGVRDVQHITVENNFFLAGKEKGKYLFHHNIKWDGNRVDLYGMMDSLNNQFGWGQNSGGFGAESMGGQGPNTRGAMQANGTWDTAHGGTATNPATAWGTAQATLNAQQSQQQIQSIVDTLPQEAKDRFAGLMDADGNIDLNQAADMLLEFIVPGNMYLSGLNQWDTSNVITGILQTLTGLPVTNIVNHFGEMQTVQGDAQNWIERQLSDAYMDNLRDSYANSPAQVLQQLGQKAAQATASGNAEAAAGYARIIAQLQSGQP